MRSVEIEKEVDEVLGYYRTKVKIVDEWTLARSMVRWRLLEGVPCGDLIEAARRYATELDTPPTKYAMSAKKFFSYHFREYLTNKKFPQKPVITRDPYDGQPGGCRPGPETENAIKPQDWLRKKGVEKFRDLLR